MIWAWYIFVGGLITATGIAIEPNDADRRRAIWFALVIVHALGSITVHIRESLQ